MSDAAKPLLVRYDLEAAARAVDRSGIAARRPDMWRWRELLPVTDSADVVSLGEAETPLVPLPATARSGDLLVKDEGRLPTGSFKARGLAVAVSMARAFGVRHAAIPTVGSGGAAMAA